VALANEFPATLALQLPASAEVWMDGRTLKGAREFVYTTPAFKSDQKYPVVVKARWSGGGKTYEAKRTVVLAAGDRSRLMIVSGDEVK
jgi:uncharacterized protein (TIGR03000 family)